MTRVSCQQWGTVPGLGRVDLWLLESPQVKVEVLTLGAIIRSVFSRGKNGQMEDVVLGFDDLEGKNSENRRPLEGTAPVFLWSEGDPASASCRVTQQDPTGHCSHHRQ